MDICFICLQKESSSLLCGSKQTYPVTWVMREDQSILNYSDCCLKAISFFRTEKTQQLGGI